MRPGTALLTAAVLVLSLAGISSASGPGNRPKSQEYQVKAQFLRHFTTYVSWPAGAFATDDAPLVIGIFGSDPFGALIDNETAGRTSHNRAIQVRRLTHPSELSKCHMVFISRSERHRQADLLDTLRGRPVLSVGETDWFLRDGGIIRLVTDRETDGSGRLRFEVNLTALHTAELKASSRMLSVAKTVVHDE